MQEFPHITKAEWLEKVEKDLKGKPLDSLNWEVEGETFTPFWHGEDQKSKQNNFIAAETNEWGIGETISVKNNLTEANSQALTALQNGANCLCFICQAPLKKSQKDELLEGIFLNMVRIIFQYPETIEGGNTNHIDLRNDSPSIHELAKGLSMAQATYPQQPTFWISPNDDFFQSIAIIRAMRLCWQIIPDAHQNAEFCQIIAHIKKLPGKTENDQKIASTSMAMGAIIGGADYLFIDPSDNEDGTVFTRRVARNIQHVLQHESYFDRVINPSAGSYYIEALTDTYARKIWAEFQQLVSE